MKQVYLALVWLLVGVFGAVFWYAGTDKTPTVTSFHCMSYDPFFAANQRSFVPPALIEKHLKTLSKYTNCVRIYTTNHGLDAVLSIAQRHNMSVILGVWLDEFDPEMSYSDYLRGIELAQQNPHVTHLVIGNEVLFFDAWPKQNLIQLIERAKYQLPDTLVTTSDIWFMWKEHPEVTAAVDTIFMHDFPFWAGDNAEQGLKKIADHYRQLTDAYAVPVFIGETGYASGGLQQGAAMPNQEEQARYLAGFIRWAAVSEISYNIAEAFDQPWKIYSQEGRNGAHFGVMDATGNPKKILSGASDKFPWSWILGWIMMGLALTQTRLVWATALGGYSVLVGGVFSSLYTEYLISNPFVWIFILLPMGVLSVVFWGQWRRAVAYDSLDLSISSGQSMTDETLFVSIHVPVHNEPIEMLETSFRALAALDWPNYEVLVCVNNTSNAAYAHAVKLMIERVGGHHFRWFYVPEVEGYKAGALNVLRGHTHENATFMATVDADYAVDPGWLRGVMGVFQNPEIAAVQCPQAHVLPTDSPAQTTAMHDELDGFFMTDMVLRHHQNALILHGTMHVVRRSVSSDWATWCICEDAEMGLRIHMAGGCIHYDPTVRGRGILPARFSDYERQRTRWAYGAVRILHYHVNTFITQKSALTYRQKWSYVMGWVPWMSDALYPTFTMLGLWGSVLIALNDRFLPPPQVFWPLVGVFVFRWVADIWVLKTRSTLSYKRIFRSMAAGAALSTAVSVGVLKAMLGFEHPFEVTNKKSVQKESMWRFFRADIMCSGIYFILSCYVFFSHSFGHYDATMWMLSCLIMCVPAMNVGWMLLRKF